LYSDATTVEWSIEWCLGIVPVSHGARRSLCACLRRWL
jgi:hypothetical protein